MTSESLVQVPFEAHAALLRSFLAHRAEIVEGIQGLLNAQRKPADYLQDRRGLARLFEDCFFRLGAVTGDRSRLRGQLQEAHWVSGFRPRRIPGLHNDLVEPAEMMVRGFHCWQQTRWPGRNGRVRYAHTLFNLYVLRSLELLSLRLWDAGSSKAGDRLEQLQAVLDELWRGTPTDQPALVRDARWLIPLAQSPTTDELAAYFEVAERVAESLTEDDRIEIRKAGVQMIGGHLRSQIRHYCLQDGVSLDEASVVRRTRTSNALDFALLVQGLVPLLEAYENAWHRRDGRTRLELASAICQGISPDPELFLNRVDLLGAYSMIEHLFIRTDGGEVDYTPMGRRHLRLLRQFEARIGRVSAPLYEDCPHFRPAEGEYSPYGAIFGTPSNLTEHMALKTLTPEAVTHFSLEDVFAGGDADSGKLDWVNGWRKLPHIDPEVQKLHAYPQRFAEDIFGRIEHALSRRAGGAAADVPRAGRLLIVPGDRAQADAKASATPALPLRYVVSSDAQIVAADQAESYDAAQLLRDRQEGHYVVSYETSDGWVAIKKDILTEVLGAGRDAKIAGLPPVAARVLQLMCPGLAAPGDGSAAGA